MVIVGIDWRQRQVSQCTIGGSFFNPLFFGKRGEKNGGGRTQTLKKKVLPLIVKFSGTAKGLAVGVKRTFERLSQDKALGMQYRMLAAYKRGRNLQDMLGEIG